MFGLGGSLTRPPSLRHPGDSVRVSPTGRTHRPHRFHAPRSGYSSAMSPRHRSGTNEAARVVTVVADVMAFVIGLWILMYLLDANRANDLVSFTQHTARWLAAWSYDLFTFHDAWARVVAGYGLAAVVYLFAGHAIANRLRRY